MAIKQILGSLVQRGLVDHVGASTSSACRIEQLDDNVGTAGIAPSAEDLEEFDAASAIGPECPA